jgi:hypothetical protein
MQFRYRGEIDIVRMSSSVVAGLHDVYLQLDTFKKSY